MLQCDLTLFEYGGSSWFLVGLFETRVLYDLMRRKIRSPGMLSFLFFTITLIMTAFIVKGYPVLNTGYLRGIYWLFFYSLGPLVFPIINRIKNDIKDWNAVSATEKGAFIIVFLLLSLAAISAFFGGERIFVPFDDPYVAETVRQIFLPFALSIWLIWLTLFVNWGFWGRIGKNTLFFCVGESMIKSVPVIVLNSFGLTLRLDNAIACCIFIFILYWITDRCLIDFLNRNMSWLIGKQNRRLLE